jgi:ABC-2 type transport system ATP-binding protein
MPQQETVYPDFTAEEFLEYMGILKGMNRNAIRPQMLELLDEVGLYGERRKKIRHMSGGMKQRLRIAQALLGDSDFIILDEPTAGLDPEQRVAVRNMLARRSLGKLIIFATHVVADIEFIADTVLILDKGQIVLCEPRQQVLKNMADMVYEVKTDEPGLERLQRDFLVEDVRRGTEALYARVITDKNILLTGEAERVHPTVQDAYLWCLHNKEGLHNDTL